MEVYLINKEKNELLYKYNNVINWSYSFVEYDNGGRCKIYCNENEYFTDIEPKDEEVVVND